MRLLAPSLLSADFLHLAEEAACVNRDADLFHLDVMDGVFVPNLSYGFPVVEAVRRAAERPLDVHLMIVRPARYVERFAAAGADMISFHLEAAEAAGEDPAEVLRLIRQAGAKSGLVINPDVPVPALFPYLEACDYVLLMSVFAGFGGQRFRPESYGRIRALKAEIDRRGLRCPIEVDGGVGPGNAEELAGAGAEILVAGSAYFKASDRRAAARAIRGV